MVKVYTNSWWPIDADGCTIQGSYVGLDGAPIAGTILFKPTPARILDYANLKSIIPITLQASLDGNGHFTIFVPATDDPDLTPIDWTYTVEENFVGGGGRSYSIAAPVGTTVDVTRVFPQPSADGTPIVRGPAGVPGGAQSVLDVPFDDAGNIDITPLVLLRASNLSDLLSVPDARSHLGLGTAAVANVGDFLHPASNLSDVVSAPAARGNLGLGSAALSSNTDWPLGVLDSAEDGVTHTVLLALGATYASPAGSNVTLTLTQTRRIQIQTRVVIHADAASTGGGYTCTPAWQGGVLLTNLGMNTMLGASNRIEVGGVEASMFIVDDIQLAPGIYTFGASVRRLTAGTANDYARLISTKVYDMGPN